MTVALPHPLLPQLSKLLEREMGLYYPEKCWGDLERGIAAAAPALGMKNKESCMRQLLSASMTRGQIEILACHLTVGETYFFREKRYFDVLEEHILPKLMRECEQSHRQLRIWSAGCCTGEEPYSIAILLDRLSQHIGQSSATILATDINPIFLEKAAEGVYSEWSFRGTPAGVKERYFKPRKNGRLEILPRIRKRVTFSYLNLAEGVYPDIMNGTNAIDIIFCRNVLMYFSPEGVMKIGKNFHRSLVQGGWLFLSPVEFSNPLFPQFKITNFPGAILYQKTTSPEPHENMVEHSTRITGLLSDTEYSPATDSMLSSYPRNEDAPVFLESVLTETLPGEVMGVPAQELSDSDSANHEQYETLCHTARYYANLGKLTEAVIWSEKAIAANKLNPAAHYLLATIWQELGQSTTARQSLTRTLYIDPDFVLAHFMLGNLSMWENQYREAVRHFDTSLALLALRPCDELLPESNGLTAGRLKDIITSVRSSISLGSGQRQVQ